MSWGQERTNLIGVWAEGSEYGFCDFTFPVAYFTLDPFDYHGLVEEQFRSVEFQLLKFDKGNIHRTTDGVEGRPETGVVSFPEVLKQPMFTLVGEREVTPFPFFK